MDNERTKVQNWFLVLILIQAVHSFEEYIFEFYRAFPPAQILNAIYPGSAKPAFILFNFLLIAFGLISYWLWVSPNRPGTRFILWIWIAIGIYNGLTHLVWGFFIDDYNPGLLTIVPLLIVALYLIQFARKPAAV